MKSRNYICHTLVLVIALSASCGFSYDSQKPNVAGEKPFGDNTFQGDVGASASKHFTEENPDLMVQILLDEISPFKSSPEKVTPTNTKLSQPVAVVELEKLKTAAKNSGLSESKAKRVRRAAELLNLDYNDIVTLRKEYNDPATSAEYGDWMRTALEQRCVHEQQVRSLTPTITALPGIHVTPEEYQRLKSAAQLSGLKNEDLEKLDKALQASKLNKNQLAKLEQAIIHHAPTPENLKRLLDHLAKSKKTRGVAEDAEDEKEYDWSNPKHGVDWLFKPASSASVTPTTSDKPSRFTV